MSSLPTDIRPARDPAALTGLLCAVVFIGGLAVTSALVPASAPPNLPDSAPADIQRYFLENAGAAGTQAFTQTAAALLLLAFTGSLAGLVRRTEARSSGLADAATGGGVLAAAFLAVSALLAGTLGAEQINDSPATVSALRQLSFFVGGAGHTAALGILVGSVSLAAGRARALPRWLTAAGSVSATLAVLSVLSLIGPAVVDLFIPLGRFSSLLMIAATSVLIATGRTRQARVPAPVWTALLGGIAVVVLAFALTVII